MTDDTAKLIDVGALVATQVGRYRVLSGWEVVVLRDGDYHDAVTIHPDLNKALVVPPSSGTDVAEYACHEVLHVAMAAVRRADDPHEAEELLVQDLSEDIAIAQAFRRANARID